MRTPSPTAVYFIGEDDFFDECTFGMAVEERHKSLSLLGMAGEERHKSLLSLVLYVCIIGSVVSALRKKSMTRAQITAKGVTLHGKRSPD